MTDKQRTKRGFGWVLGLTATGGWACACFTVLTALTAFCLSPRLAALVHAEAADLPLAA